MLGVIGGVPSSTLSIADLLRAGTYLAGGFWVYFLVQRCVLGPLNADEIYFAHVFWMIREGNRQFVDFYSNHLPTYFALLRPLVFGDGPDLNFLWLLRFVSLLVAVAYAAMAWSLRRDWIALPLLFAFLVLARMTELRPDTFGLLLFNAAWFSLLYKDRRIVLAAILGAIATLFTARAAVMMTALAPLCLYLARNDRKTLYGLVGAGFAFVSALAALWLAQPQWARLVFQSVFIDPLGLMPDVPLVTRVFDPGRLPLVLALLIALVISIRQRHSVLITATVAQIVLILVDPSPFQYVYGWAAIPIVMAIASASRKLALGAALVPAGTVVSLALAYVVVKGHEPPSGSILRLSFDLPADPRNISTERLASSLISGEHQQGLWNQLALRSELCRRINGKVLAVFVSHPVCLRDSLYHWVEFHWPGHGASTDHIGFYRAIPETSLFVWGKLEGVGTLPPRTREALRGSNVHDGFAIRK